MARFRMTALAFALVLVAAFAVAEAWRPVAPAAPGDVLDVELASALRSFDDCGDFLDTVRAEALKQVTPYGLGGIGGMGGGEFAPEFQLDMGGSAVRREAAMEQSGVADMAAGGGETSSGAAAAPPPAPAKDGVVEVSGTNVQERGVDEPDVIKTDGNVMAAVARGRLQLVDLRDGGRRLAATLPLSSGWGHELLLHDGRLLITGNVEEPVPGGDQPVSSEEEALTREDKARPAPDGPGRIAIMPMGTPKLELTLLDVRDPAQPKRLGSVRLDGQLVSSRLVDGMVRVVMRSNPQPAMAHPEPGPATNPAEMRELESQATARNEEIVRTSEAEDWLPAYTVRDADGATVASEPLVACDDIRHPEQFRGFGLLSVLAVPMTGDNAGALVPTGTASVQGDGDTVYATPDRLYVAMNRWEETGPQPRDQIEPATDPAVGGGDNSVVSDDGTVTSVPPASGSSEPFDPGSTGSAGSEPASQPMPIEGDGGIGDTPPDQPIDQPMPVEPDGGPGGPVEPAPEPGVVDPMPGRPVPAPAPPRTFVDIHEFDTSDPARPVYTASGSVPGHLLNQWSLSAHQGHLRIATTDGQFGFEGAGASESAVYVLRREGTRLVETGRVTGLGKGERIYAVRYFGDYGFVVTFRQTDPLYTLDLSDPAAPRVVGELKVPGFSAYLHPVGPGLLLGVGQNADETDGRRLGVQVSLFDVSNLAAPARVANLTMEPESSTEVEHEHRAFLWWPAAKRAVLPYMRAHWDEKTQRDAGFFGALALDVDGDVREAGRLTHVAEGNPDPWWAQIRRAVVVGDTLYTMSERGLLASDVDDLAERGFLEFTGPTPQQHAVEPGFGGVDPGSSGVAEPMPERLIVD